MTTKVTIDPLTRIEGHLSVKIDVEEGKVSNAECVGEMFRGFEAILAGRHPLDAQQITQRICGVCPVSHGIASCLAQEDAYGIAPPRNGWLLRNLIQGANYLNSHITHFYQLSAVDWMDLEALTRYEGPDPTLANLRAWTETQLETQQMFPLAPFFPRYEGSYVDDDAINELGIKNYVTALDMRAKAHQLGAMWCGKLPHAPGLVPGGITEKVTVRKVARFRSLLKELAYFIDNAYLPDVFRVAGEFPEYLEIGKGCENYLTYGVFVDPGKQEGDTFRPGALIQGKFHKFDDRLITEDTGHSRFSSPSGLQPDKGRGMPDPHKPNAYSWIKAPRYNGQAMEVGPLARMAVAYHQKSDSQLVDLVEQSLEKLSAGPEALASVLGRHLTRALEASLVVKWMARWGEMLDASGPTTTKLAIPESGIGRGLTEAPRGALGHWIVIEDGKIANYQCVVPTTWNCSPRDDQGVPGPTEQALMGTPIFDTEQPIEAARIVRSFDPCLACAVH